MYPVNYLLSEREKQLLGAGNHTSGVGGRLIHQTLNYARCQTRVMRRQPVPSRSCQSRGEGGCLIRGIWVVFHWLHIGISWGSFKQILVPGDSDLIVLGCGLGIRTFKSPLGNCNCVRVECGKSSKSGGSTGCTGNVEEGHLTPSVLWVCGIEKGFPERRKCLS